MARGQRSAFDSTAAQTKAFQLIKNPIQPTLTLSDVALTYFNNVISSRERATWNDLDIHHATRLALALEQVDLMEEKLNTEGWFQHSSHGVLIRHPAATQMERSQNTALRLTRVLGLSASAREVSGSHQAGRNKSDKKIQETIDRAEGSDGILA